MQKNMALVLATLLLSSILVPYVHGSSTGVLNVDMNTDRKTYFTDDVVNVTYYVFGSNGRVVDHGNGTWFLNYTSTNTNVANGTVIWGHGYFEINLADCNITHSGGGTLYTITLLFRANNESTKGTVDIYIMNPDNMWFYLNVYPMASEFYPGTHAMVDISSIIGNLHIDYLSISYGGNVWKNITTLSLDEEGRMRYIFQIPETWEINKTVVVSAKIGHAVRETNFTVEENYGIHMEIQYEHEEIISGDVLTVAVLASEPIDNAYYHFHVKSSDSLIYRDYTYQNFTVFRVPANFSGQLYISCDVFNSTEKVVSLQKKITIRYSEMWIYFDRETYHGGDEFTAFVHFRSNVMKNCTFLYSFYAMDAYGNMNQVYSKESTEMRMSMKVPENPPAEYKVMVRAMDSGHVESAASYISYSPLATISAGIITKSSYATGVFTPGETIEIHYRITGNFRNGLLYYGFDEEFYRNPEVKMVNGTVDQHVNFKIPDNIESGVYVFHLKLKYHGGETEKDVLIHVDSSPPWSQYLILTMPAGDFVTLIIIASIAIFAMIHIKYPRAEKKEFAKQEKEEIKDEILDEEL